MKNVRKPKIVGLTGGIATGKSTVSAQLRSLGAHIIDADAAARTVLAKGSEGLAAVAEAFGPDIVQADGTLDRKKLAGIIFADAAARRRLDAITHPRIYKHMQTELEAKMKDPDAAVIVLDIPLLFETGLFLDIIDESVVVYADRDTQLARLMARDKLTRVEAEKRIAAQMPIEEKVKLADRIIDNSGSVGATAKQVAKLWKEWVTDEHCPHCP